MFTVAVSARGKGEKLAADHLTVLCVLPLFSFCSLSISLLKDTHTIPQMDGHMLQIVSVSIFYNGSIFFLDLKSL